jgi:hypothetical protein
LTVVRADVYQGRLALHRASAAHERKRRSIHDMAKARAKAPATKPSSTADIQRYLLLERLRGPIIPSVAAGIAVLLMVLANAGAIDARPALTVSSAMLLLLALFFGLSDFLDLRVTRATALSAIAFAVAFGVVTYYPMFTAINWPPPIGGGDIKVKGPAVTVPLAGARGDYRLVVEGHLPPSADHAAHSEHYRIKIAHGATSDELLDGDFSDRWGTQRLGRRGTAPVHIERTMNKHDIQSPGGEDFKISLDELAGTGSDVVTVRVYPAAFPTVAFAVLGVMLTAFAWLLDTWRPDGPSDSVATTATLSALLGVAAFRHFAPPQPGFGDLLFNGSLGVLGGYVVGWVLWRATSALR